MNKIQKILLLLLAVLLLAAPADAKVKYTKASKLGMKKNSPEYAAQNYQKLQQAIANHKNIKLNGTYYISCPKPTALDYTLYITGGEMIIENGRPFDLADGGGIHATKSTFRRASMKDSQTLIGGTDKHGAILATEVYFENCKVYGQQLLQLYFQDIDGSKQTFGIGQVVLKNNYLEGGGRVLILDGIIRDKCVFEGNTYQSFPLTPIYICYNHSAKRYNNEAGSYKYVEENIRRSCAVDIIGNTFNGMQTQVDYYYCTALIESVVCNFKRNTIRTLINYTDGKKLPNATCYDTYLSCSEVYYEGNTITDMISYSKNGGNKPLCEIGKSKINVLSEEGYKTIRHYTNNTYTVDATPLLAAGADPKSLYVGIFGNTDYVDDYQWTNNRITLSGAYLNGRNSSIGYGRFTMTNNSFEADSITGYGLCMLSGGTDMESIQIENNNIISQADKPFYLFNQVAQKTSGKAGTITIQNNTISGTAPKIVFNEASEVTIQNNKTDGTASKQNYYLSDYTGAKKAAKIGRMNVEMPCATSGGFSDATLSSETAGSYSYSAERLTKTGMLRGTYFLTKDGTFSIGISYTKDGKEQKHTTAFERKGNTLKADGKALGNGVVWKTLYDKDGITLKIRYSQNEKLVYYEASSTSESKNDKNTKITLTVTTD